jgi:hypothetical protein
MKKNSKSKAFETMIDIICDFLMVTKDISGGVNIPEYVTSNVTDGPSDIKSAVVHKKSSSQVRKPSQPVPHVPAKT